MLAFTSLANTTTTMTTRALAPATAAVPAPGPPPVQQWLDIYRALKHKFVGRKILEDSMPDNDEDVEDLGQVLDPSVLDTPLRIANCATGRLLSCQSRTSGARADTSADDDASGKQRWVVQATEACGDYTVRATKRTGGVSKFLSVRWMDPGPDMWPADDDSGRQRWRFVRLRPSGLYRVWVSGGRGDARLYLTAQDDGSLALDEFSDKDKRQQWALTPLSVQFTAAATAAAAAPAAAQHVPRQISEALLALIGLAEPQVNTVMQLMSLAENGHPRWWSQYGYIGKPGALDGPGYVVFGGCDLASVLDELGKTHPRHPLAVARSSSDDVWEDLVRAAADDPSWQQAVWTVFVERCWRVAATWADSKTRPGPALGLAVSRGFIADAAAAHGAEGLGAIAAGMHAAPGSSQQWQMELQWLLAFIDARGRVFPEAADRCELWRRLVEDENYSLARPIQGYSTYWGSYILL